LARYYTEIGVAGLDAAAHLAELDVQFGPPLLAALLAGDDDTLTGAVGGRIAPLGRCRLRLVFYPIFTA
jgi:hypothetical protein